MMKVYAQPHTNGTGSQNRAGSGENFNRPTSDQRRGNETMGNYLGRTGQSALGATKRTRGRLAAVDVRRIPRT